MFLNYTYHMPPLFTLAAMFVPTGAFTLSLAPLTWVVLSEIYPQPRPRQGHVDGHLRDVHLLLRDDQPVSDGAGVSSRTWFGNPGGTFLIFLAICLTCSSVRLAVASRNERQDAGRNRRVLAAKGQ